MTEKVCANCTEFQKYTSKTAPGNWCLGWSQPTEPKSTCPWFKLTLREKYKALYKEASI